MLMKTDVVGISIRDGGSYYDKSMKYRYPFQPHLLSIEDPQDPDNDIAQSSFNYLAVKSSFEFAHHILAGTIYDYSSRFVIFLFHFSFSSFFFLTLDLSTVMCSPRKASWER